MSQSTQLSVETSPSNGKNDNIMKMLRKPNEDDDKLSQLVTDTNFFRCVLVQDIPDSYDDIRLCRLFLSYGEIDKLWIHTKKYEYIKNILQKIVVQFHISSQDILSAIEEYTCEAFFIKPGIYPKRGFRLRMLLIGVFDQYGNIDKTDLWNTIFTGIHDHQKAMTVYEPPFKHELYKLKELIQKEVIYDSPLSVKIGQWSTNAANLIGSNMQFKEWLYSSEGPDIDSNVKQIILNHISNTN
eukprot:332790_1